MSRIKKSVKARNNNNNKGLLNIKLIMRWVTYAQFSNNIFLSQVLSHKLI
jgi:hypothetical protein